MVVKHTFICSNKKVLEHTTELTRGIVSIKGGEVVQIDIRIDGYTNDREPRYLTEDQFHAISKALETNSLDDEENIFTIRYHVLLLDSYNRNSKSTLIINSCMYSDGGYSNEPDRFLGYGGRKFKYKRYDSDEEVLTNNLWNGTELPEYLLDFMPDNAEWIKG